jgi:hypothetical protein
VASFEEEMWRLRLNGASISNPNTDGPETGMDVLVTVGGFSWQASSGKRHSLNICSGA